MNPHSTILRKLCPACKQNATERSHTDIGTLRIITLECGHTISEDRVKKSRFDEIKSIESYLHKYKPYDFQASGVEFLENANCRGLIADEMGLGKTIQALLLLKRHPELFPVIVLCKSSLKAQWFNQFIEWFGMDAVPQIIDNGKDKPLNGFKVYVVGMDLLRNLNWTEKIRVKTIIIDECQLIKNPEAKRTKEVRKLCKDKEYIIGLSGTPIKNHAGEYFTILNILRPENFPFYAQYLSFYCETRASYYGAKVGGIRKDRIDYFNQVTSDFIIRRTREEVMPDLPRIRRTYQYTELGKEVEEQYKKLMQKFSEAYDELEENKFNMEKYTNVLDYLNKMRHITGLAKIEYVYDYVVDFLNDTDRKIVIFVHHIDVGKTLRIQLENYCKGNHFNPPLTFTSDLTSDQRQKVVDDFWKDENRILIASTLAGGEGINLQCCSDAILMERQWNPANEEQAEARFPRIGFDKEKLGESINVTYFLALGTPDEYLNEIVEKKRAITKATMDGQYSKWDESSTIRDVMELIKKKGMKRWSL